MKENNLSVYHASTELSDVGDLSKFKQAEHRDCMCTHAGQEDSYVLLDSAHGSIGFYCTTCNSYWREPL